LLFSETEQVEIADASGLICPTSDRAANTPVLSQVANEIVRVLRQTNRLSESVAPTLRGDTNLASPKRIGETHRRAKLRMRILIAPDKFKGSLGARAVGAALAAGVRQALPAAEVEVCPLADGGEGTADVICSALNGEWVACPAHDARGRPLQANYCWSPGSRRAVLEMSAAAGLVRLAPNERDPLRASTFGVGEMLRAAAARGADEILVGLGGSATNDAGFGLARALGFHFFRHDGLELTGAVSELSDLTRIEVPDELKLARLIAACDVRNPLLGTEGATRTFAAQKGATPDQIEILERALTRLADVAAKTFGCDHRIAPGAGADGCLGFGLLTFCGATIRSGFEVVAELNGLREKIARADIVITGEGKLDRQTLAGKVPAGVARLARAAGKRVFAIVGQAAKDAEPRKLFDAVITLDDTSPTYRDTAKLLERHARALATGFPI
jgi:glycerate kinase